MQLHELRFSSPAGLARAVKDVLAYGSVEDCLIDEKGLTVRFRTPSRSRAALLLAQLHPDADPTPSRRASPSR